MKRRRDAADDAASRRATARRVSEMTGKIRVDGQPVPAQWGGHTVGMTVAYVLWGGIRDA